MRPEDFEDLPPIYRQTLLHRFLYRVPLRQVGAAHGFGEECMQPVIEALHYCSIEAAARGCEMAVLRIPAIRVVRAGRDINEGFTSMATRFSAGNILSEAFNSKCPYDLDEIQQRMARCARDSPHEFLV